MTAMTTVSPIKDLVQGRCRLAGAQPAGAGAGEDGLAGAAVGHFRNIL